MYVIVSKYALDLKICLLQAESSIHLLDSCAFALVICADENVNIAVGVESISSLGLHPWS